MTLLSHILSNPSNPSARADLKLIEPLLRTLDRLAKSGQRDETARMYQSCTELFERARAAVAGINPVRISRIGYGSSGQSEERESLEDFLRRVESISSGYDVEPNPVPNSVSGDVSQVLTFRQ